LPHPQVMIFDLGGVFIHHNPDPFQPHFVAQHNAPEETLRNFYLQGHKEHEKGFVSSEKFYQRAVAEVGYAHDYARFRDDYCRTFDFRLNGEMYEFVQWLRRKHGGEIEFWLLSNINEIHLEFISCHWPGVFSSFLRVFLSCNMGCRKPDAEIYERALKEGERSRYRCAFIDDLEVNGEYPRRIGMFFHKFENVEKFKTWLPQIGVAIDQPRNLTS